MAKSQVCNLDVMERVTLSTLNTAPHTPHCFHLFVASHLSVLRVSLWRPKLQSNLTLLPKTEIEGYTHCFQGQGDLGEGTSSQTCFFGGLLWFGGSTDVRTACLLDSCASYPFLLPTAIECLPPNLLAPHCPQVTDLQNTCPLSLSTCSTSDRQQGWAKGPST